MVVEPVGATLAVLGLLKPAFEACRELYKGYRLTQSFGEDYDIARRDYDFQIARLEAISQRKLKFLEAELQPWAEDDPITHQTISKLVVLKAHFGNCSRLFKKYIDQEAQAEAGDARELEIDEPTPETVSTVTSPGRTVAIASPKPQTPQACLLMSPPATSTSVLKGFSKLSWMGLKRRKKHEAPEDKRLQTTPRHSKEASSTTADRSQSTSRDASRTVSYNPEAFNRSRSADTSTEVTSISGILSSPAVLAANGKHDDHSDKLQQANHFFKRVVWAADDKALLFSEIKEIRDCNTDLEDILKYREPRDASQILDLKSASSPALRNVHRIQNALKRLHEALIGVNQNSKTGGVRISVKLVASCDETAQDLSQEDNLTLREKALVFVLQVHETSTEENVALEVLAETLPLDGGPDGSSAGQHGGTNPDHKLQNLLDAVSEIEIGTSDNTFEFLGTVSRSASLWDQHNLFYDTETRWYCTQTLDNVIDTDDFRSKLSPVQRTQLAILLSITHLYLADVRPICSQPHLSQFVFYTSTNKAPDWNEIQPFVLNPYLSFGFGNRKPRVNPGARSGIANWKKLNSIVELGLLLHQISSCAKLDYGEGAEGRRRAKQEALRNIHAVDQGCGGKYAEVVEMCLNWNHSVLEDVKDEECEVLQQVVQWLMKFEEKLDG